MARMRIATRILSAAGMVLLALPALAQQERAEFYDQVRGWQVNAYLGGPSGFQGCRAVSGDALDPILIGYVGGYNTGEPERWQLQVWTSQLDVFGGGVLTVDGRSFDAQFGFSQGVASRELSRAEVQSLRNGNRVTVAINGDTIRTWSLRGSAAAMQKALECHAGGGVTPQRQAQTAQILQQRDTGDPSNGRSFVPPGSQASAQAGSASPQRQFVPPNGQSAAPSGSAQGGQAFVPPQRQSRETPQFVPPGGSKGTAPQGQRFNPPQNQQASSAPIQGGGAVEANCDAPFSGSYLCNVFDLGPQGSYPESYEIHDVDGFQPSYLFRVIDEFRADAWVRFNPRDLEWIYMGEWQRFGPGGQCAEPSANLTDEARLNLGQDAWELCIR